MPDLETTMLPPFETLDGHPMDPATRRRVKDEIHTEKLKIGGTRASVLTVRDNRRLVLAVHETMKRLDADGGLEAYPRGLEIDRWPTEFVDIATAVDAYLPMAYLNQEIGPEDAVKLTVDSDWACNPEFLNCFVIKLFRRGRRFVPLPTVPAKGNLQPLCTTAESLQRRELLRERGRGIPWQGNEGYQSRALSRKLLDDDHLVIDLLPNDHQLAVMLVLAADTGRVAFFSADGQWPQHPFVDEVAGRLGVQPLRFSFANFPATTRERLLRPEFDPYTNIR